MKNSALFTGVIYLLVMFFSSCEIGIIDESIQIDQNYKSSHIVLKKLTNTGSDIYGYNWSAHRFNGYLLNAWTGDNLVPLGNYYHWVPCTEDTKDHLEKYSADDCFFWNFRDWTAHPFNGYLLNTWLEDNIVHLANYYHWDPYTGDDRGYLEKYPAEDYFFWDFREMTFE